MKKNSIPMFQPFIPNSLNFISLLNKNNISYGEYGNLFEESLRTFINNEYTLTFVNFNIAYFSLLGTLGIKTGDEVLVSPLACLESLQPLKAYGLRIKWVDVNYETGLLDLNSILQKITKKTKLIVINHYLGNVADIRSITRLAKDNKIQVINDCIDSFGSRYNNYILGDIIHNSNFIFSFSAVRNPNTVTGACVCFSNNIDFHKCRIIRDNGIDRSIFRLENGEINPNCDIKIIGYSGLMNEISSYIGYIQMLHIDELLERQVKIARKWSTIFSEHFPEIVQNFYTNHDTNYWVYGFHSFDVESTKSKLDNMGFSYSQVHINNNIYSIFEDNSDLPNVSKFMQTFLAVPTGWWVKEQLLDVDQVNRTKR